MDDLQKFKNLLEYFVTHLEYAATNDENGRGYEKYIKPHTNFNKTGQGHKGDRIQKQISSWANYNVGTILISIQSGYQLQSTACYLQWKTTGVDICARWKEKTIESLFIVDKDFDSDKLLVMSLDDLGLFDNNTANQNIQLFFDTFAKQLKTNKTMKFKRLLENNYNLILTGAPGTGKTYLAREIAKGLGASQDSGRYEFVQFHPSYDYTDFVEGLRPKQVGDNVVFERKDGIFKAFCKKAAKDTNPENKYVFVIDEINRGEISKIFGELFFSIDPGYRGETDKDTGSNNRVKTQYQNLIDNDDSLTDEKLKVKERGYYPFKKGFYVPSNVYVIGTMNDIDRSVESMDFAFRRRFAFYEVNAKETQDSILAGSQFKDAAIKKMDALNDAIEKQDGFSSAYHIGAAYFKKIDKYSGDFGLLWDNHIKGVLFEYLRGLPNATEILKKWKEEFDK